MLTLFSFLSMIACQESTTSIDARCEIAIEVPTYTWTVGATETLQAFPMTSRIDTLVTINDVPISVLILTKVLVKIVMIVKPLLDAMTVTIARIAQTNVMIVFTC